MHLGIIKITYNRTAQPRCYHNAFYGRPFREPRRGDNSDFAVTIWHFWISDCMFCFCYWLLKCRVLRVVCVWESERETHHRVVCVCVLACVSQDHITIAACVQIHTSIITVSVTRLCSSLGLELMVKLRTLLTAFTLILKAKSRDYGKGRYISDECLRCSANHNVLCQLANQSRLRLSEGGTL